MKFKFIGDYTNGHTSITIGGVTFDGNEPEDVRDEVMIARLSGNPDFAKVTGPAKKEGLSNAG